MIFPRRRPILYVVDDSVWVQRMRYRELRRHLSDVPLELCSVERFRAGWPRRYRRRLVYFASWRILLSLSRERLVERDDLCRFIASVTSHYNLGGGLAPETTIPADQSEEEAFAEGVELLRGCAVVTANCSPLVDLLAGHVPGVLYLPNGVDADFFRPPERHDYDPARIRVGWVGKRRRMKNLESIEAAAEALAGDGVQIKLIVQPKGAAEELLVDAAGMRDFYHGLDYYLVASWQEGTPNPALEAAACGVPVVATRVGNMPDLVRHGENGFFVEPSADAIVEAFRSLKGLAPEEHRRLRVTMRAEIERAWTWRQNAARYREAFDLLRERQRDRVPA